MKSKKKLHLPAKDLLELPDGLFKELYLSMPVYGEEEYILVAHERAKKMGLIKE